MERTGFKSIFLNPLPPTKPRPFPFSLLLTTRPQLFLFSTAVVKLLGCLCPLSVCGEVPLDHSGLVSYNIIQFAPTTYPNLEPLD